MTPPTPAAASSGQACSCAELLRQQDDRGNKKARARHKLQGADPTRGREKSTRPWIKDKQCSQYRQRRVGSQHVMRQLGRHHLHNQPPTCCPHQQEADGRLGAPHQTKRNTGQYKKDRWPEASC